MCTYKKSVERFWLVLTVVLSTFNQGTRETAFVTAAWAGGAVQAVTRACSRGRISTCDCDITRRGGSKAADSEGSFTWGGCSDPIRFGMRLVRLFQEPRLLSTGFVSSNRRRLRSSENRTNGSEGSDALVVSRALMDIHNQMVGRRVSTLHSNTPFLKLFFEDSKINRNETENMLNRFI